MIANNMFHPEKGKIKDRNKSSYQVDGQLTKEWNPESFLQDEIYRRNLVSDFIQILNKVEVIKNPKLRSPDTGEIISGFNDFLQGYIFINPTKDNSPPLLILIHEMLHILFDYLESDERVEQAAKLIYEKLKEDYESNQQYDGFKEHPFKILTEYIPQKNSYKQPTKY